MSIIRFIGDVHGKFGRYKTILARAPQNTIQVGDMGVGFRKWPHGEWSANPPFDQMLAGGHRFIRGNHDNPQTCREHQMCIPDGVVEDNMMFIGGALSIDRAYRTEGYSWWPDEELSVKELLTLIDVAQFVEPEIMVTHECPESIAEMIVGARPDPRFASRTRTAFQLLFHAHQPKLWLFGHWHVIFDKVVGGTRFICLPELASLDVDVDKCEVPGPLIVAEWP